MTIQIGFHMTDSHQRPTVKAYNDAGTSWLVLTLEGARVTMFTSTPGQIDILADAFARAFPDPELAGLDPKGDHFPDFAGRQNQFDDGRHLIRAGQPTQALRDMDAARRGYPAYGQEPVFARPAIVPGDIVVGVDLASGPDETAYTVIDAGTVRPATFGEIVAAKTAAAFEKAFPNAHADEGVLDPDRLREDRDERRRVDGFFTGEAE